MQRHGLQHVRPTAVPDTVQTVRYETGKLAHAGFLILIWEKVCSTLTSA